VADLVTVRCACGHRSQAQAEHLGQEGLCPACGERFLLWPEDERTGHHARAVWHLKVAGRVLGPFEPEQLRTFVAQGRVQPGTPVRKGSDGRWVAAQQVRGLLDTLPSQPSVPPPRPPRGKAQPRNKARPNRNAKPSRRAGRKAALPVRHASSRGPAQPPRSGRSGLAAHLAAQPGLVLGIGLGIVVIVALVALLAKKSADMHEMATAPTTADGQTPAPTDATKPPPAKHKKKPKPLTTQQVVARSAPSVAIVMGRNASGTGFLVAPGVIATNRHVLADDLLRHITLQFPDAEKHLRGTYGAKLIYEDPDLDLAFLAISIDLPALPLAKKHGFQRGEEITVIGSPGMGNGQILRNAISRGLLSTEAEIDGHTYYQLDVAVNPGNSGGPVFNNLGQVIGVVTLKAMGKDGLGFCLPLKSLKSALQRAQHVSADTSRAMTSMHRMRVTSAAVLRSAGGYVSAGELYVSSMEKAMAKGVDLNIGLRAARAVLSSYLRRMDGRLLAELREDAPKVLADTDLPPKSRDRFERLWTTYNAIKEHVSYPKGTFASFKEKCADLHIAHDRIMVALDKYDGVSLDDE